MPSRTTRAIALAASTAFLVTSVDLRMAFADSASSKTPGQELSTATGTDFSARKKRRRGGNAAAFAAIAGTIGAIAAAQAVRHRHRHYYHEGPIYYGGPAYYAAPGYYGGYAPHAYAPRHYYSGPGHGWHGRYGPPASGPQTQSPGHL